MATRCWLGETRCNSPSSLRHVRRRFCELATPGTAPIASEALARIGELYRIEGDIRGRTADDQSRMRDQYGRLLVDALQPWPRDKLQLISQKINLAEAIRYTLPCWRGLSLYDGRIEIDNNVVELTIRLRRVRRR
jgi:transposase